jgi:prepilin-type N-terminal cleavage/methylation domain-containing protein
MPAESSFASFSIPHSAGHSRAAFTLIEMAIVIVIMGLLMGGVLVGQDLIRSAELQSIAADADKYRAAAKQFKDQYFALPGDFSKAGDSWGYAHATPANCKTTPSVGKETCNGDGNGKLEDQANSQEWFRFWQQLEASEILEDHFTGVESTGGSTHAKPNTNVPDSTVKGSGWTARWAGVAPAATYFDGAPQTRYGHVLEFGASTAAGPTNGPNLNAQEGLRIDEKIDDGRPGRGKVLAHPFGGGCNNAANKDALNAAYLTTDNAAVCSLVFRDVF